MAVGGMIIKVYEEKYRDDLIFMVLQAKDALGRVPAINPDLLDVNANYFEKGANFWIAVDDLDRVIGCVGYSVDCLTSETFLHRLFIKAAEKRKGIGSALLKIAENEVRNKGITELHIHLGEPREQWFESYAFYSKHGYVEYKDRYMKKEL